MNSSNSKNTEKEPKAISRHVFTIIALIILSFTMPFLLMFITMGLNSGPISDMAGIGFFIMFIFVLVLILPISIVSELGRRVLENRIKWWVSTPIMFLIYTGLSFLLLYSHSSIDFNELNLLDFYISIPIGVLGVIYWIVLLRSESFIKKVSS